MKKRFVIYEEGRTKLSLPCKISPNPKDQLVGGVVVLFVVVGGNRARRRHGITKGSINMRPSPFRE